MAAHAKLSPSAAEQWMNCPGSLVLCEGIPEKTSPYAEEGTKAHALAEDILTGGKPLADAEMRKHVGVYVDHVQELASIPGAVLHVEKRVKVTDDLWGTADAIVWVPSTKTLYVRDLKYGAGVPVEVGDNLQLKLYALAALLTMGYRAHVVEVGICQPRIPHADGLTRSKEYDAVDLMEFYTEIQDAVSRVKEAASAPRNTEWDEDYLHPTDKGCRWCLAAPTCPKVKSKTMGLVAAQVFSAATPYDPEELAKALDFAPIAEAWIKNLREFAYAEAERGVKIPGHKLVAKRATRKWKTNITTHEIIQALGLPASEVIKTVEPKTVAQLEPLVPESKLEAFNNLWEKESSGHTLVPESDKREAVTLKDAASTFVGA